MDFSVGAARNPQGDKAAHHDSRHNLSYRKIGNRNRPSGIEQNHYAADNPNNNRNHPASSAGHQPQSSSCDQIGDSQKQCTPRCNISVDQNRIIDFHMVACTVRSLYEIKIIIHGIYSALKKNTCHKEHDAFTPCQPQSLLPTIKIGKQRWKEGSHPRTRRR